MSSAGVSTHTSSVPNAYGLPLAVLGAIILICIFPLLLITRRSSTVRSKLERYVAATPSPADQQFPPEVQAVFAEAKAQATALPGDARAIGLTHYRQVAEPYRENLVRLVYFTAASAQGMDQEEPYGMPARGGPGRGRWAMGANR
jgi:hypothetical protein